jgi:glycosyltransferase involved in cell wall biosynthesis
VEIARQSQIPVTSAIPSVSPLALSDAASFWSVMIPTYNARVEYLEQALRSVLAQNIGADRMQIEVIDDCSTDVDVEAAVHKIAGNRVRIRRSSVNKGLAGCWNACIEHSHGRWVHILHQDDWVLPGFYARFEELIDTVPEIDAAVARYLHADHGGHWTSIAPLLMRTPGELRDFATIAAQWVPMQCCSAIVKRSTYERVGGYRNDLPYVLDWEMWCRIAASGRWGYVPQVGAVYREHGESETTRLRKAGKTHRGILEGGRIARSLFPASLQIRTASAFRNTFSSYILQEATASYVGGNLKDSRQMLDVFRDEGLKSNRRWDWFWLWLRVWIKLLRRNLVSDPG